MRDQTQEFEIREFIPADSRYPVFSIKIRNVNKKSFMNSISIEWSFG